MSEGQDKREEAKAHELVITSTYKLFDELMLSFDDGSEASFSDVEMVIPGLDHSLSLHRVILSRTSKILLGMLQLKASTFGKFDPAAHQLKWEFGQGDAVYSRVLVKWLKFCYGQNITILPEECGAAVAILFQLQLSCTEKVLPLIEKHMVSVTENDIGDGAKILLSCAKFDECDSDGCCHVAIVVAKKLLTRENITKHDDEVVKGCLFHLPPGYLDHVEFDEPHSEHCEFITRCRYLEAYDGFKKDGEKSEEEKEFRKEVMRRCDFSKLNSSEMHKLKMLDILGKDELIAAFEHALKASEEKIPLLEILGKMANTSSETSTIATGDATSHDGGAIYDPVRKIILSVSGNYNNGKNIKVTRMRDSSHGDTTTSSDVIPFGTHGQCPVFDGVKYTYFFQSEDGSNNRFGRLAMDTLKFEELAKLPSGNFLEFSGGCCHKDKIYILNNNYVVCEYDPSKNSWKTLSINVGCNARLLNDPQNSDCIYALCVGKKFITINLHTSVISESCKPPTSYSLGANNEAYLMRTAKSGFFIFATFGGNWFMYSSLHNMWSGLPNWKETTNGSAHFVFVQEGPTALYHVDKSSNWDLVHLPPELLK